MRLLRAELIKLRHRWATYVVLGLLLALMVLVFVLIGLGSRGQTSAFMRFPGAYGVINQFVFGLGSLLAVAYAAAIGGADWNWGTIGAAIARGESRARYVVVKF